MALTLYQARNFKRKLVIRNFKFLFGNRLTRIFIIIGVIARRISKYTAVFNIGLKKRIINAKRTFDGMYSIGTSTVVISKRVVDLCS